MVDTKTVEVPVIWLQCATCTGCSVSVLNSVSPTIKNVLVDEVIPGKHVNLRFQATVMAGAGDMTRSVIGQVFAIEPGVVNQPASSFHVGRDEWIPITEIDLNIRVTKGVGADLRQLGGVWRLQDVGDGKLQAVSWL